MVTERGAATPSTAASGEAPSETLLLGEYKVSLHARSTIYTACFAVPMAILFPIAYKMRVRSIDVYGYLFHRNDPWFNYRAAEYMSAHGWSAFFSWFDYMSWYPLGRPVGTTTYPGLQLTAVAIHRALAAAGVPMSLNNVCVLIPAWFSLVSSAMVALLAHEMTGNMATSSISSILFSVVPAHLMRSMAGEFDNECIAVAAMLLTFYLWVRSLRTRCSWPIGILTGIAYGYMVAAWGGYIFVLNMVAMHAGISSMVDWARNTYNPSLLRAYALFYVVGTAIATRVPPVGMSPFRSLEQLGALVVLLFLCGLQACETQRSRLGVERFSTEGVSLLVRIYAAFFVGIVAVVAMAPAGFFKPLSLQAHAMIAGAQPTGNTLVDMLIAKDASSLLVAWELLLFPFFGWMVGMGAFLTELVQSFTYTKSFMLMYGAVGMYFASQSVRMMVMMAPVACIFTALLFCLALDYALGALFWAEIPPSIDSDAQQELHQQTAEAAKTKKRKQEEYTTMQVKMISVRMMPLMLLVLLFRFSGFIEDVAAISREIEVPGIVFPGSMVQGLSDDMIDDYYAGYLYLRDNTPADARVLSWWDYGYQITGIGNRTSLADGNTWNHEHIATIGKMLTSPVAEAHSLVRHMADYVLIFAGDMHFSDLINSPMMARIGNSVYHDICPNDPLCSRFVFQEKRKIAPARSGRHINLAKLGDDEEETQNVEYEPSPLMAKSLIYHLHSAGVKEGVTLNDKLFQHVYTSAHGLMRIFKVMNVSAESKKWVADPANRVCHPPGSWICPGQYPPAKEIQEMLAHRYTSLKDLVDSMSDSEREGTLNGE
ncbi:oligosaccharyl transferase-like protein [Leishmania braziliensis MHOM/BR/75/M2904]|uniref:dolichyl-diphosphooligosaccharide--protein glycotransferase n=2 Tax=Leishmania braziliensis TaxID=5660 RepID=A4HMD6_LEIBR|nr:oligosaccharyl transferase-like protein [Leishmania braziliensis MHOM/BR/75/M2904]CAM43323.1 oligosaccharyl transferase-like protein [Leishmania braziliensis MHOM/BR/75/M2904]